MLLHIAMTMAEGYPNLEDITPYMNASPTMLINFKSHRASLEKEKCPNKGAKEKGFKMKREKEKVEWSEVIARLKGERERPSVCRTPGIIVRIPYALVYRVVSTNLCCGAE